MLDGSEFENEWRANWEPKSVDRNGIYSQLDSAHFYRIAAAVPTQTLMLLPPSVTSPASNTSVPNWFVGRILKFYLCRKFFLFCFLFLFLLSLLLFCFVFCFVNIFGKYQN